MNARWIGRLLYRARAGERHSLWHRPGLTAPSALAVTSADFADGQPLPADAGAAGVGENRSPQLGWGALPDGVHDLILIMEDVDVPLPRPVVHTLAVIEADRGPLAPGELATGTPGVRFVPAAFGRTGYQGPAPVPGHGPHHYGFMLFAVDPAIDLTALPTRAAELLERIDGHVLARGRIVGAYERS